MISTWTDDYLSGIQHVDEQHKHLFHMVNSFINNNDETISNKNMDLFLDSLLEYCAIHFHAEEYLMAKTTFPLMERHIKAHEELGLTVKRVKHRLKEGSIKNPYVDISAFVINWLNNHIGRDDLTFFNYYENSQHSLDNRFLGRVCAVSTMDNKLVGYGKITSIKKNNEVEISNSKDTRMPVDLNDIVKVTSTAKEGSQTFVAQVYVSRPDVLKLFNATIIQVVNNRKHCRVTTDIEAKAFFGYNAFSANVSDMGMGGLKMETAHELELGNLVAVDFTVLNGQVSEMCEVKRVTMVDNKTYSYGLEFKSLADDNAQKIGAFVFNRQTMERKGQR